MTAVTAYIEKVADSDILTRFWICLEAIRDCGICEKGVIRDDSKVSSLNN